MEDGGGVDGTGGSVAPDVVAMFDRCAATYDSEDVEFFSHFGRRLVSIAGLAPGDQVLDVGAGRGAVLLAAADAVGSEGFVTGIDLAPQMVRLTRRDLRCAGVGNAEMRWGDAMAPAFPPDSFDVILGGLMACFLPGPRRAFGLYHELLRPSGRLGLSTFEDAGEDYEFLTELVRRFLPAEEAAATCGPKPATVNGGDLLDAALRQAGFGDLRAIAEEHVVVFRDEDHWWRWQWSHGQRRLLELVPERSTAAFRRAAYDALEPLRRPDGTFALRFVVRYTVAHPSAVPVTPAREAGTVPVAEPQS